MKIKKRAQRKAKKTGILLDIEKSRDSEDLDVEAHIPVLLQTIANLKLEKIDLKSKDSAAEAVEMLNKMIDKLTTYKNTASTLRRILESDEVGPKKH